MVERRDQLVGRRRRGRDVDRRREHVVGRLAGVDVVVGVHVLAERPGGEGREHLVDVHVARRARAGLEHVDRELRVVLAGGDLLGGSDDRVGDVLVEHAQLGVGLGAGGLDLGEARICAGSSGVPEIGKFSTARWVWARHRASAGTRTSPMVSCSMRYSVMLPTISLRSLAAAAGLGVVRRPRPTARCTLRPAQRADHRCLAVPTHRHAGRTGRRRGGDGVREVRGRQADTGGEVVGVHDELHRPGDEEVVGRQRPALPRDEDESGNAGRPALRAAVRAGATSASTASRPTAADSSAPARTEMLASSSGSALTQSARS